MILRRLIFALSLLIGALASQLPEYAQQYRQRLGGAIDELQRIVAQFDRDAASEALDREAALKRLQDNADALARNRAVDMRETIARESRLSRQQAAMREAGSFGRLAVFARDFDAGIARRAWGDFEPALPATVEGFVIGVAGFLFGGGLLRLVAAPFRRRRREQDA
ncbi:MAG: DUF2937 family protein [Methylobacteriaceae bacterium]|nr:DUF2937 family protein [Methylobacteriaceae bacterium]